MLLLFSEETIHDTESNSFSRGRTWQLFTLCVVFLIIFLTKFQKRLIFLLAFSAVIACFACLCFADLICFIAASTRFLTAVFVWIFCTILTIADFVGSKLFGFSDRVAASGLNVCRQFERREGKRSVILRNRQPQTIGSPVKVPKAKGGRKSRTLFKLYVFYGQ